MSGTGRRIPFGPRTKKYCPRVLRVIHFCIARGCFPFFGVLALARIIFNRTDLKRCYSPLGVRNFLSVLIDKKKKNIRTTGLSGFRWGDPGLLNGSTVAVAKVPRLFLKRKHGLLSAEFNYRCSHQGSKLFHQRSNTRGHPLPRASVYPHKSIHRSSPPFGCQGKNGSLAFRERETSVGAPPSQGERHREEFSPRWPPRAPAPQVL